MAGIWTSKKHINFDTALHNSMLHTSCTGHYGTKLKTLLQKLIGLKSKVKIALLIFGIKTRYVKLIQLSKMPLFKNLRTTKVTSSPVMYQ